MSGDGRTGRRNRGGRGAGWSVAAALLGVAVLATACHLPPRLGVATTVVPVHGSCDPSAVVEVGASVPLTGPDAALGRAELTGLRLGVQQVDRTGGVLTSHRCLELMYKNDRSDPAVDNQALLDLVNREHVAVVVGPFVALADAQDRAHLGSLGLTAATFSPAADVAEPGRYPYTFPIGASEATQAGVAAAAVKRRGWRQVVVVASGSAISDEGVAAFVRDARRGGVKATVAAGPVDSPASAARVLGDRRPSRPAALVVFDDGATLGPVLQERHSLQWDIPVLAVSQDLSALPADETLGVDVVAPSALSVSPGASGPLASFRARVLAALHASTLPGVLTPYAQGYDAVLLFAGAVNGVNADDPGSIRTYLENANYDGLLGAYDYTATAHTGLAGSQLSLLPLGSLSDGVFVTGR